MTLHGRHGSCVFIKASFIYTLVDTRRDKEHVNLYRDTRVAGKTMGWAVGRGVMSSRLHRVVGSPSARVEISLLVLGDEVTRSVSLIQSKEEYHM